ERGSVLAPEGRLRATSMIDARLELLPSATRALTQRARVRLHHGTAEVMARVVILNPERGSIQPGGSEVVQLRLEQPLTAIPCDRLIMRSYSPQITIGGGVIIDALPQKHRIRDTEARARLEKLEAADLAERIAILIEMAGVHGMSQGKIAARTGATDEQTINPTRTMIKPKRAF